METNMDWEQVSLLDGAAPCFFVEGPEFCGRAESYPGHGNSAFHNYISLEQYIFKSERKAWDEAIRIARNLACDHRFSGHWQNGYGQAKGEIIKRLEAARDKGREVDGW